MSWSLHRFSNNAKSLYCYKHKKLEKNQTLGPSRWTRNPLSENPTNAPIEEASPHKLCMSPARDGWLILFCVTQASIVTSAIATPALPTIRDNREIVRSNFLSSDSTSMEITPITPGKEKWERKIREQPSGSSYFCFSLNSGHNSKTYKVHFILYRLNKENKNCPVAKQLLQSS